MIETIYSREFDEYELVVTNNGFFLVDKKTDQLIIDASNMRSYWFVEISGQSSDRKFYINYNPNKDDFSFGISQRIP